MHQMVLISGILEDNFYSFERLIPSAVDAGKRLFATAA